MSIGSQQPTGQKSQVPFGVGSDYAGDDQVLTNQDRGLTDRLGLEKPFGPQPSKGVNNGRPTMAQRGLDLEDNPFPVRKHRPTVEKIEQPVKRRPPSALDKIATEKHIDLDPDFRSWIRQMGAQELQAYMSKAYMDEGGRAYLQARLNNLLVPFRIRQAAWRLLQMAEGKNPPIVLSGPVQSQMGTLADTRIQYTDTELVISLGKEKLELDYMAARGLEVIVDLAEKTKARHQNGGSKNDVLNIQSFLRPKGGWHAKGFAFDIYAYGGHLFDETQPLEERAAIAALVSDLNPGYYGLGLPRLPTKYATKSNRDLERMLGDQGQRPGDYAEASSFYPIPTVELQEKEDPSFPQRKSEKDPDPFGMGTRESMISMIVDADSKKILQDARQAGKFFFPFPDGFKHAHLSVVDKTYSAF